MSGSSYQFPNEEYEAQFYGFLPSSLVQGIVRLVEDRMDAAVSDVEDNLAKLPPHILPVEEHRKGSDKFRSTMINKTGKILSKLQHHLTSEVLSLPPHLLLPCDGAQSEACSLQDIEGLKEDIKQLHLQLDNEMYMQSLLKAEADEAKVVVERQENLLSDWLHPDCMATLEAMGGQLGQLLQQRKLQIQELENTGNSSDGAVNSGEISTKLLKDVILS